MATRIAAIGLNHDHIYGMTEQLLAAGAELTAFHETDEAIASRYAAKFPGAKRVADRRTILEDASIACVLTSAINADRCEIGIAAMRHGKDVLADKPGVVSFEQLDALRAAHAETGRRYIIHFSERVSQPCTAKAEALVASGAIGRVINTVGLGPHRMRPAGRPDWFFRRARSGGILVDIAAHQFDQFLTFTGSTTAEVVAATVRNTNHPQFPELQDFGEALVRTPHATGYIRVDWFTPEGLPTWGDGRIFLLGTEGTIELRKYVDIAGRPGGDHLFLFDGKQVRHIDAAGYVPPFGARFMADLRDRTETAMTQAHAFAATELALKAQAMADAG
ncbi:Gfo/Idh/MocA family protein [Falsiroseomonas sp. HW251]|uniref:Gfo/Idh/MocA family protein n=1 Tax=Falsiroseomonas sp. HW251 TaxID=3390998 RepID=UPI003D323469